jgi:CRP-like cAMP-binding protein
MNSLQRTVNEALQASKLGQGLSPGHLAQLAEIVTLRSCKAGDVLAREGDVDEHLYALVEGSLALVCKTGNAQGKAISTLVAGDLAHELGFLDGSPRYASLVAASDAQVLVLERSGLESLIERNPRLLYALMRAILRAAHQGQSRMAMQSAELTNYIVKQEGRY